MIVRLIAVKVEFIINEIINTIVIVQLKNSAILLSPGNINIYISDIAHFVFEFLGYALIQRHNHTCIYVLFTQCLGKRT